MQRQHTHPYLLHPKHVHTQTSPSVHRLSVKSPYLDSNNKGQQEREIFDTRVNIRFGWAALFFCLSRLPFFIGLAEPGCVCTGTGMTRMFGASFTVNAGKKLQDWRRTLWEQKWLNTNDILRRNYNYVAFKTGASVHAPRGHENICIVRQEKKMGHCALHHKSNMSST